MHPIEVTLEALNAFWLAIDKRGIPHCRIRLGVKGGGCSGFSYVIEFDDREPCFKDITWTNNNVGFVVDKKSLLLLTGSVIDHEKTMMRSGFKFTNPQEASRCGCGTSFTVK